MKQSALQHKLHELGDAYINFISPVSKKLKYHIGTTIFSKETSPYIFDKFQKQYGGVRPKQEDAILVFCWDLDDFKMITSKDVVSVVPLNQVIKQ